MPYKFSAFYENKQGRKILLVEEIKLFLQELRRPQIGVCGVEFFCDSTIMLAKKNSLEDIF